jgi:hypothetical protein
MAGEFRPDAEVRSEKSDVRRPDLEIRAWDFKVIRRGRIFANQLQELGRTTRLLRQSLLCCRLGRSTSVA